MKYALVFLPSALAEWEALDNAVKIKFKKVLARRLEEPRVPSARLRSGTRELYKIKLKNPGFRLVYEVFDETVTITVITVGKRDKVYQSIEK